MKANSGTSRPRPAWSGWMGALVVMLGVAVLAACSSTSTTTASNAPSSAYTKALAYSKCIRSHGIPNFPDPNSSGQFVQTGAGGISGYSQSVIQGALNACQSLAPSSVNITPAQKQAVASQAIKFAQCMRSHGVTNFADPSGTGEISLPKGVNPNSPTFQKAQQTCQSLMPQQAP